MKILALSGSFRTESSNFALLKAIHNLLPENFVWNNFILTDLPYFDPQLQFGPDVPPAVILFRSLAIESDFIIISTPEYAHGIPGVLKNALEWLICEETIKKKAVVFITSPSGGEYVKEYLLETIRTMDMSTSEEMSLVIRTARKDISLMGDITNLSLKTDIIDFLKKVGIYES